MAVFFYDLLRTTRRGRVALLRTAYALALLVALYSVYVRWFSGDKAAMDSLPPSAMAKFAEEFFIRFLLIQTCAVVLLTPAFTAGAIAEERQRGTLDCVLTTHLTPAAIVLGKLAARMAHLFGILLTGLPVLALLPLWGGVDPWRVVGAFAATAMTMLTLAALGLWCSASARTVRGAVIGAYALAAVGCSCPMCVCVNPLGPLLTMISMDPFEMLTGYGPLGSVLVCQVPLTVVLLSAAERDLRLTGRPGAMPAVNLLRTTPSFSSPEPPPHLRPVSWRPRVGDWPLLWKELHVGGNQWVEILAPLLVVLITLGLGLTILFSLAAWVTGEVEVREQLNFIVRAFAVILLAVVALATLFHATGCVGREREQKTLDMLLMLPDGRDGLLEMKWLGSFLCGRWLMAGLLAVLALGVIGGGIDPVALPLLAIVAGTHLALIASLGVFLSVLIPGTARAGVMGVVILVVACIIPLIVYPGAVGAIPPVAWVLCLPRSFGAIYLHRNTVAAMSLPVGVIVYAGAGVILWLFAQRRFESESG